jgi:hypothetical protein
MPTNGAIFDAIGGVGGVLDGGQGISGVLEFGCTPLLIIQTVPMPDGTYFSTNKFNII